MSDRLRRTVFAALLAATALGLGIVLAWASR